MTVFSILVGLEDFTAGVAETKIFWLVSMVSGGTYCRLPQADWIKLRLGAQKLAVCYSGTLV